MFNALITRVFGSRNDRQVKGYRKNVARINNLSDEFAALSDGELRAKTDNFRQRISDGASVEDILPESFAAVREAASRVLGMRHFDVQLIGGMVLNDGRIAEMRTGEGKTLVATLPAYLNALVGEGVHVVTVNDYLAERDARWMGQVYEFLGLTTGVVVAGMEQADKVAAYACDITYGTNNEFGFDYLRDNMAFSAEDRVQRKPVYAIVDEVDSILIDEARTPLIISGPAEGDTELYQKLHRLIPKLERQTEEEGPGDYSVDEKNRQIALTEAGHERVEELLVEAKILAEGASLYDAANVTTMHYLNAAIRANTLFEKDVHYVVNDGQVVIVDEFTGRLMAGRRWSDGLHQAVEAKEGVAIRQENQTLASITFQNYFRLYDKLSGMTGTADTEAYEFQQIYGLEVLVVPTHVKMIRDDRGDQVFLSVEEKYEAVIDDVLLCHEQGQPVLVGTASIDSSELLSRELKNRKIRHEVLNAKQHEREAEIIAGAGVPGAVTIATNMAGRGTDIVLGGNLEAMVEAADSADEESVKSQWQAAHDKVLELGGLHVIGTERNESRRVDNQLRGRSGRQGDPGSSRFYLSLEDDLMRIFASDRVSGWMQKLGLEKGEAIEHRWVTRAIENAQRKVEGRNFDMRKQLLEYDDIANEQRLLVYRQRSELLEADSVSDTVANMREDVLTALVTTQLSATALPEEWDTRALHDQLAGEFALSIDFSDWLAEDGDITVTQLAEKVVEASDQLLAKKRENLEPELIQHVEKSVMLQVLDSQWKDHLAAMDHLRQGIHLRGYAQKNPKQEYKRESFEMFTQMLERVKHEVTSVLMRVEFRAEEDAEAIDEQRRQSAELAMQHPQAMPPGAPEPAQPVTSPARGASAVPAPFTRPNQKIGRNQPCPCGSGKKYKQCHGKLN
ncbi:MAG: preprotein translocase subunit SecA [Immundisolibacteraceae bacterium]|nr:preprotein translocase subunit SecA [Immundisolibacteraceae bacterium]